MPVIDPNNPLSAIGQSNDPTLGARTAASHQSLMDLQNGLAALTMKGQNQRANTNLAGQNQRQNTTLSGNIAAKAADLLPFQRNNINPLAPDAANQLNQRRLSDKGFVDSGTHSNLANAAKNMAQFGRLPGAPEGAPASQVVSPNTPSIYGERLGDSAGRASVPTFKSEKSSGREVTGVEYKDGSLKNVKETNKATQTATTKASHPRIPELHKMVTEQFKKQGIPFANIKIIEQDDTTVTILLDGVQKIIKKNIVPNKSK